MNLELRRIYSPDVDLEKFRPAEAEEFRFLLEIYVCIPGQIGEERLQVTVISAAAIVSDLRSWGPVFGTHLLIVDGWNYKDVVNSVERTVGSVTGASWPDMWSQLSWIGRSDQLQ